MQHRQRSYKNSSCFMLFLGLIALLLMLNACASTSNGDSDDDADEPVGMIDSGSGDGPDDDDMTGGSPDDDDMTSPFDPDAGGTVEEMVELINEARAHDRDCGNAGAFDATGPVTWDDRIGQAALRHSTDMATHEHFEHPGTDGSSAGNRIADEGYAYSTWGENIFVGPSTVKEAVDGWLDSPGHCANIMRSQFTQMGAAALQGNYRGFNLLYWTLNFATPR